MMPTTDPKLLKVEMNKYRKGSSPDVLYTDSLTNCIAIVVYCDNVAVMCHYNTGAAFLPEDKKYNKESFEKIKGDMIAKIGKEASAVNHCICLGKFWTDVSSFVSMRTDFEKMLTDVFEGVKIMEVTNEKGAGCCYFDIGNAMMYTKKDTKLDGYTEDTSSESGDDVSYLTI